ncbi:MAG: AI-2E family transporter [Puniceicoccales bacterium]|jgi:predicted PurR-regulated permease PerM|nr:AI-2E family transporter [Puniceicoccales bacterium]
MSQTTPPFLSPLQRRLAAASLTCVAAAGIIAFAGSLIWLLGKFVATFSSALWPLVIAGLASFLLQPVCLWLERRLHLPRAPAICILYIAVACLCALLALIILPAVFHQFTSFIETLPALRESAARYAAEYLPANMRKLLEQLGVAQSATASVGPSATPTAQGVPALDWVKSLLGASLPALAKAGAQAQALFTKAAGLAIIPVYLFYLLDMRRDFFADLHREAKFLPASLRDDLTFLARQFTGILVSYFRGQLLIGIILGVLLAAGFTIAGLKFGLLLGLLIGVLNMVPWLGTMLGLGIALPLACLQQGGGSGLAITVAGMLLAGMLLESFYLTPKIAGKTTRLHPMAITFSVFFWGLALDGLLGMVLAVPLTAFFVVFWRLLKTKYLPKLTDTVEPHLS